MESVDEKPLTPETSDLVFRILVVDDTPAIHQDFRKILSPAAPGAERLEQLEEGLFSSAPPAVERKVTSSFVVNSTDRGEAAVGLVSDAQRRGQPYSVAFVDMRMAPGMDGLETISKLWRVDPFLQVVICTAYSDHGWSEMVHALGASDAWLVLRKPFDSIEVLQAAHALSRKWLLAQDARRRVESLEQAVRERTRALENKNQQLRAEVEHRQRAEVELVHIATHDALTGVPNRHLLRQRLDESLSRARRKQSVVAVLLLDLDHFKEVNDAHGHLAGDQLLRAVSGRLRSAVRAFDLVARMGGDEFILLLDDLSEPEEAGIVAQRIQASFKEPFSVAGQELHTRPSIGIAIYPHDCQDADSLLKSADVAMYEAKETAGVGIAFYADGMLQSAQEKLRLREQLMQALERDEFRLVYQPLVDIESNSVCAFEALVRWEHPDRGVVPPIQFVPVAEKSGLIIDLGAWVLNTACQQLRAWQQAGRPDLRVAVNVSAREVQAAGFLERVISAVHGAGIDPGTLEIELTESVAMKDPTRSIEVLQKLHEFGVRLAIDDFGSGHSSLMRLKEIPISVLKIDRCFVKDITSSERDASIVRAVVGMAHSLGLTVVAEGVETTEQLNLLKKLEPEKAPNTVCDRVQGYLIARPLAPDAATTLLRPVSDRAG